MTTIEEAEATITDALQDAGKIKKLWAQLDYNGNGIVSVAELDKFLGESFPVLKNQRTIIRAFKYTTLIEGDKDSWIEKYEFVNLLKNILYFHKVYTIFNRLDSDGDHRVSFDEFKSECLPALGLDLSEEDAQNEFDSMDADGHGMVLFAELCRWFAVKKISVDGVVLDKFTTYESGEKTKAKKIRTDRDPNITTKKFAKVENKIQKLLKNKKQLRAMWRLLDINGNGIVSLAEVDKFLLNQFATLRTPRAVIRAFKYTTLIDGDGDEWIEADEFPALLRNIIYFNKIYDIFEGIDTDGDHRISLDEFKSSTHLIGLSLPDDEAEAEFQAMDSNSGGVVLFDEFAAWCASRKCPVDNDVREEFVMASAEMRRRKPKSSGGEKKKATKTRKPKSPKSKFAKAAKAISSRVSDKKKLKLLWRKLDRSADGHLSLSEVASYVSEKYPPLGRKTALRRAYNYTVKSDTNDGNNTIEIDELPALLSNIIIFHKILSTFDTIDSDNSKKIVPDEFQEGLALLGIGNSEDGDAVFKSLDKDGSGELTLSEFTDFALEHKDTLLAPQ
eukprot:m.25743 g.25743  ORF g.25743 m.25743 type:complete len:559 (-) comp9203_c0_seq1:809-2485(-)